MKKVLKKKRRGFVMTGGGAKGLYEAGVIHAFHLLLRNPARKMLAAQTAICSSNE